jgi:excisionase family DNA binding protein
MKDGKQLRNKLFVDVVGASEYLGVKISTIYSWTHLGTIDFFKPKGKIYFKIADLNNFVLNESCHYKSTSTIEQETIDYLVSQKASA